MRIVSGKYKRRIIQPPKNLPVRPTTDMAKESLFNILGNLIDFHGMKVLDLFAGTGNISYEFVSRGCSSVTAIEKDFGCVKFIKQTSEKLQMPELRVIKQDVFRFIDSSKSKYNVIFADPPYSLEKIAGLPDMIFNNSMLADEGWFILEHPREHDFSEHNYFHDHRKYGSVNFTIFHNQIHP